MLEPKTWVLLASFRERVRGEDVQGGQGVPGGSPACGRMTTTMVGVQIAELMAFLLAACGSQGHTSSQQVLRTRVRDTMLKHQPADRGLGSCKQSLLTGMHN